MGGVYFSAARLPSDYKKIYYTTSFTKTSYVNRDAYIPSSGSIPDYNYCCAIVFSRYGLVYAHSNGSKIYGGTMYVDKNNTEEHMNTDMIINNDTSIIDNDGTSSNNGYIKNTTMFGSRISLAADGDITYTFMPLIGIYFAV